MTQALSTLATPIALVQTSLLHANVAQVAAYAKAHGLRLRPHVKTHKDPEVARLQLAQGAIGLTCATLKEAEVMSAVCDDILIAFPPVDPARIQGIVELSRKIKLTVALDSRVALERLEFALREARARALAQGAPHEQPGEIHVLLEVDLGGARVGLPPSSPELPALAAQLKSREGLHYSGILFHAGDLRVSTAPEASLGFACDGDFPSSFVEDVQRLNAKLQGLLQFLREHDATPQVVSAGNTPTLFLNHLLHGVTEIRPGTYVYCDRDIASQRIFPLTRVAYTIVTTVISTAVPGQIVVDAGTKALAKEPLPGLNGLAILREDPRIIVRSTSEEHGILRVDTEDEELNQRLLSRFRVGDRLHLIVNHVCVSVHLQDQVAFVDDQGNVEVRSVAARGR